MKLHTLLITASLVAAFALSARVAGAKRAMPPTSNICNKTTHKVYVATSNYAGRGHVAASGWTFIKPGACKQFQDDSFHFRGKRIVTGLSKLTHMGCVKYTKRFSIILRGSRAGVKSVCTANGGHLVKFTNVSWRTRLATINILR